MSDEKEYRVKLPGSDELTEKIVEHVASQMMHGGEYRKGILDEVTAKIVDRVTDSIDIEVSNLVREAFAVSITPTNEIGEPTGQPVSLRKLIIDRATAYFETKVDSFGKPIGDASYGYRDSKRRVEYEVGEAVKEITGKELHTALKAATDEVRTRIAATVQQSVFETVKKLLALP